MTSFERRLAALERQTVPPGPVIVRIVEVDVDGAEHTRRTLRLAPGQRPEVIYRAADDY